MRDGQLRIFEEDEDRLRAFVEGAQALGTLRLPPEPKLSEELAIPRGRLRTILKRLEDEGLLWRHVGKGTFAGPRRMTADDSGMAAAISVDNIMDARLALEPQLAARAAIAATPADIAAMESCVSEMAAIERFETWRRLDERLHRLVAEATHNMMLLILYDTLRAHMRASLDVRMKQVYGPDHGPKKITNGEHHAFIDAIGLHDPQAAERAMRDHLVSVRAGLFGLL